MFMDQWITLRLCQFTLNKGFAIQLSSGALSADISTWVNVLSIPRLYGEYFE